MTVLIKIGRRKPVKFTRKAKGPYMIQSMIWKNIDYGMWLSESKMKKFEKENPDIFSYSKRKFTEEEGLHYNIEWIEIIINSTDEIEDEEYNEALQLFNKLEDNPRFKRQKDGVEIDPELAKEYSNNLNKGKVKKYMDKGYERIKGVNLNKNLNEIGILTIVEKYAKEEENDKQQEVTETN